MSDQRIKIALFSSVFVVGSAANAQSCADWYAYATPNPGAANGLAEIAVSSHDAWAVGNAGLGVPLILRFDQTIWEHIANPDFSGMGANPSASTVTIAGNDTWILGSIVTGYPTNNLPLALRYRNNSWDRVERMTLRPQTEYPYAARGGFIDAAFAVSENDIWAVGNAVGFGDGGATSVNLAAHFDGSTWTDVPTPIVANRSHYMRDIHGISSNEIWVAGYSRDVAMPYYARVYRYNGSTWSKIATPAENIPESFLNAVHVNAFNDIWVGGSINYNTPLLMHYDGTLWSIVSLPAGLPSTGVRAIAGAGPNHVWISFGTHPQLLYYSGRTWQFVGGPSTPTGSDYRVVNSMVASGACNLWAAGTSFSAGVGSTYIAKLMPIPQISGDVTGDGTVNVSDLLAVLSAWGACLPSPAACPADIAPIGAGDELVNVADLLMVITNWS